MAARLLFVGDIHLGRTPSRLPSDLAEHGVSHAELTPAAAWRRTVERAIAERVDAVVLAGDVVDRLDDRFEAMAPLREGVERLVGEGVPVLGVAGNHDVEALPRLARQIEGFRLLGADGRWQTARVDSPGGVGVRLLGWSFPSVRVRVNPLDTLRIEPEPGVATLGVLHCDVDAGSSPYAPVGRAALQGASVDAWLLGHVHRPDALGGERPIGYLGSLSGLDPGESGPRGPWLVEVEGPGRVRAKQLALAPIRYERVAVEIAAHPADSSPADAEGSSPADAEGSSPADAEGSSPENAEGSSPENAEGSSPEDAEDAAFNALWRGLREVAERIAGDDEARAVRLVACRVELSGPGRHAAAARRVLDSPERHPTDVRDGAHYFVERIEERARPDFDLEAIAVGDDPPALLARRLLVLQRGGPAADALLARAGQRLDAALSAPHWQRLPDAEHVRDTLAETLVRAGTRRLEALLDQRAGSFGTAAGAHRTAAGAYGAAAGAHGAAAGAGRDEAGGEGA